MAKFRKFGQGPVGKDWLKYRPYQQFSSYDRHYVKLAQSVFAHLNHPKQEFRDLFHRDDLIKIAVILTCYYEDYINEIGIWQAFIQKNQELYGYFLPFYDLEAYEADSLNPQDFAYLIWHQLGKLTGKTLNPYGEPILAAANFCYDFFEEKIEESPTTDFYDEWLDISEDIYFFNLKERLIWMAFENYLVGPEFIELLSESLEELFEEPPAWVERMSPEMIIYGIREDYLYKKSSSFCALSIPEWLAEVARCSEELKADIRLLFKRVQGNFVYKGIDAHFYHFEFLVSGRSFAINRQSVDIDTSRLIPEASIALFGIVNWRGEWWLTGSYMDWESDKTDLDKARVDLQFSNFYAWTEKQQQQLQEMTEDMEEAFLSYFGKRLVFFPNQQAMAKAIQDHNSWWNEHKTKTSDKPQSKYAKMLEDKPSGFEELDLGSGTVAAFFFSWRRGSHVQFDSGSCQTFAKEKNI